MFIVVYVLWQRIEIKFVKKYICIKIIDFIVVYLLVYWLFFDWFFIFTFFFFVGFGFFGLYGGGWFIGIIFFIEVFSDYFKLVFFVRG